MTHIDIGVIAYEACLVLVEAGFTFAWHESQSPLNRYDWPSELPGMPPQPPWPPTLDMIEVHGAGHS